MDKYGRINRFPEFQLQAQYLRKERSKVTGPFTLVEVNRIAGFVVMEDGNGERHRFYEALFRFVPIKSSEPSGTRSPAPTAHSCP